MRRLISRSRDVTMPPAKIVVGGTMMERGSVARVGEPIRTELNNVDQQPW
jgi:hypothetical protein